MFLTSTNALTRDGKLVNIDGTGNRVAELSWSSGKTGGGGEDPQDLPGSGVRHRRARDAASPPNARRLGLGVPCATLGHCVDCDSPRRICRAVSVSWNGPPWEAGRALVLVDAPLGLLT